MADLGDRQPTSPEKGPLRYSVPIEEALSAFRDARVLRRAARYEREGDEPDHEPQSEFGLENTTEEYLYGLNDICKNGLPDNGWSEVCGFIKLRQQGGIEDPFHEEPKLELLADELQEELKVYHIERTAGVVNYYNAFLEAFPQLVRLKAEDGPFLRGIDAEIGRFDTEAVLSGAPTRLVVYDESGEAVDIDTSMQLFVNKAALPAQEATIIERYYRDMGL